jgi:hypothetical protein
MPPPSLESSRQFSQQVNSNSLNPLPVFKNESVSQINNSQSIAAPPYGSNSTNNYSYGSQSNVNNQVFQQQPQNPQQFNPPSHPIPQSNVRSIQAQIHQQTPSHPPPQYQPPAQSQSHTEYVTPTSNPSSTSLTSDLLDFLTTEQQQQLSGLIDGALASETIEKISASTPEIQLTNLDSMPNPTQTSSSTTNQVQEQQFRSPFPPQPNCQPFTAGQVPRNQVTPSYNNPMQSMNVPQSRASFAAPANNQQFTPVNSFNQNNFGRNPQYGSFYGNQGQNYNNDAWRKGYSSNSWSAPNNWKAYGSTPDIRFGSNK